MDKETMWNMSYDELHAIIDPDYWEYVDYMKDVRGIDIHDKEACWQDFQQEMKLQERDLSNYFERVSKEEAWERYEIQSKEDIQNSIEDTMYAEYVAQTMQWHHIEPLNVPYWKRCVDLIEEKLK